LHITGTVVDHDIDEWVASLETAYGANAVEETDCIVARTGKSVEALVSPFENLRSRRDSSARAMLPLVPPECGTDSALESGLGR
jgi:hypothetical protein